VGLLILNSWMLHPPVVSRLVFSLELIRRELLRHDRLSRAPVYIICLYRGRDELAKQTYVLSKSELEALVTAYAANQLGIQPTYAHSVRIHGSWLISDLEEGVMTITIMPAPNVIPLRPKRRPRKTPGY
jgi:hypothetical protein